MRVSLVEKSRKVHCFIVGAKYIGQYGEYEIFVMKFLEYSQLNKGIRFHVLCKADDDGHMDVTKLMGVKRSAKTNLNTMVQGHSCSMYRKSWSLHKLFIMISQLKAKLYLNPDGATVIIGTSGFCEIAAWKPMKIEACGTHERKNVRGMDAWLHSMYFW